MSTKMSRKLQFNGLWISPTEGYAKRRYVFCLAGSDTYQVGVDTEPWYVIVKMMTRFSRCQGKNIPPLISVKVWHGKIETVIESWNMIAWTKDVAKQELKSVVGHIHAASAVISPQRALSNKNHIRLDLRKIKTRASMSDDDIKAFDNGLSGEQIKAAYAVISEFIDTCEEDDGPS